MKMKRVCLALIFCLMCLMVLVGCQMEAPVESPAPTPETVTAAVEPAAEPVPVGQTETGERVYQVSTVDELIAAIGPDRSIYLEPGIYDLSAAQSYGGDSGEYWYWNETYDGDELVISGVQGLRIIGGEEKTEIVTAPRYANVLKLSHCSDVAIEGLTLGHWPDSGSCSGGVVYLDCCDDVEIYDSYLYGCGIIGITAINSRGVHAIDSHIYDCSQNAVFASSSFDVMLLNCRIHDNGVDWSQGLFYTEGCNGFALVNCGIYDNYAPYLVYGSYTQQLSVLGCSVENNSFSNALFCAEGYSPVVDKSCFDANGCQEAFLGTAILDAAGNELTWAALENMQREDAGYAGPREAPPVKLEESINAEGLREVRVDTVDEFLSAIGSDTVIKLCEGDYDFSKAADYGAYGNEYYYWVNVFDGPGLVISGVSNLSIEAEGDVSIAAIPRYANVISFVNCDNISLSGFTAGHTQEPGECAGGVLDFENCYDVNIDDCRLYGCGILGIRAYYCSDIDVENTEIYDCSIGAIALYTVMDASFESMDVHDCGVDEITLTDSMDVSYEGEKLSNGRYTLAAGMPERSGF